MRGGRLLRIASAGAALSMLALLLLGAWLFDPRLPGGVRDLDVDRTGALTPEQAGPLLRRDFAVIDADGSGELDGRELRLHVLGEWWRGNTRSVAVPALPVTQDPDTLRAWLDDAVAAGGLRGVGLVLLREGEEVFRHQAGDFDASRPLPLGSAGMWLAATQFTCLDVRGDLAVDAPLSTSGLLLPDGWGRMTPAAILGHVAGAPATRALEFPAQTRMEAAASALMARHLSAPPGEQLRFGGAGMQVAAWVAEQVTGQSWRRQFIECLGWPMSLHSAGWGDPISGPRDRGFLSPGFGLHLSLDDYARFLSMLQQWGRYDGVGVVPRADLEAQELEQAAGLPARDRPPWAQPEWGHARGAWCERTNSDGRCTRLVSPGGYGVLPWLDREQELAGVLATLDSTPRVMDWLLATRTLAEQSWSVADD